MSNAVIGTCSTCGGPVTVLTVWYGVIPPTPTCSVCGATAAKHGPVINTTPTRQPTDRHFSRTSESAKKESTSLLTEIIEGIGDILSD